MHSNILKAFLTGRSGWYICLAAVLLAVLCFILVILNGVRLWHQMHQRADVSAMAKRWQQPSEVAARKSPADWHLFGMPVTAGSAALPQTHLQLELSGIMMGADPGAPSMAIISGGPGQPGQVYRVGDTLPSLGVRVYAITRDGVVLENGGHFERLNLQRQRLQFKPLQKTSILSGG